MLLCAREKLQRFYMEQMILGSIDAAKMDAVALVMWELLKLQPVPQPHMMDTECTNMKKKARVAECWMWNMFTAKAAFNKVSWTQFYAGEWEFMI